MADRALAAPPSGAPPSPAVRLRMGPKARRGRPVDPSKHRLHEEIFLSHAVLGNHLINTNSHGLKFDYVVGNGVHEWTQVLNLPVY